MTVQPHSKPIANRTETVLDFPQLARGYIETPLGKKLARAGIRLSTLAELSQTSRADVSHYAHKRRHKIGRNRRQRIFNALCELGVLKRRARRPPVCKNCGISYPTRRQTDERGECKHFPERRV